MPSKAKANLRLAPIEFVLYLLGLVSLAFSFYATSVGFHHTLFEFYGFRQAQTAISADAILHGGSWLHYETPVLGPPWSLPFEFPLYQIMVAGLARLFSAPLEETGRLVSILCYYLCFFPLASILARLGLRRSQMVPALALFAVSPIYAFVSRLFMIESTVLLLSLLYTDQVLRLAWGERRWQVRHVAGTAVFGVLAGLVKVTTLAPFFALGTCLIARGLWEDRARGQLRAAVMGAVAFCSVVLPVAATWGWTKFADHVKAQNPFGVFLTSKALTAWNFGTFAQRLHPRLYLQLFLGADNHVGSVWVAVLVLAAYLRLCRRSNGIAVVCVALYVGTMLVFFNLHVVHEYYSYANAIFLLVGAGALIAAVLNLPGKAAWTGVALLLLEMGACGYRYFTYFYPLQTENDPGRAEAAAVIDRVTEPGNVILVEGLDWSSELPYQSHRRAIMDATFDPKSHSWSPGPIEAAIRNARPQNVTALVACSEGRYKFYLPMLLHTLDMEHSTDLHPDDCDIYERKSASTHVADNR